MIQFLHGDKSNYNATTDSGGLYLATDTGEIHVASRWLGLQKAEVVSEDNVYKLKLVTCKGDSDTTEYAITVDLSMLITQSDKTKWDNAATFIDEITGDDTDNIINKWEEVVAFLDSYAESDSLTAIVSSLNGKLDDEATARAEADANIKELISLLFTPHYASDGSLESIQANAGLWTNSFLSARGKDDTAEGSGIDLEQMWNSLVNNADTFTDYLINIAHIPISDIVARSEFKTAVKNLLTADNMPNITANKITDFTDSVNLILSSRGDVARLYPYANIGGELGKLDDWTYYVLALIDLSQDGVYTHAMGRVLIARANNLQAGSWVDYNVGAKYATNGAPYAMNGTVISYGVAQYKPVTFTWNGKRWGGIQIARTTAQEQVSVQKYFGETPTLIPYYKVDSKDTATGTVLDETIYNELNDSEQQYVDVISNMHGSAASLLLSSNVGGTLAPVYFSSDGAPVSCGTLYAGKYFSGIATVNADSILNIGESIYFHASTGTSHIAKITASTSDGLSVSSRLNVNGALYLGGSVLMENNQTIYMKNTAGTNCTVLNISTADVLAFGYGTSVQGHKTLIYGAGLSLNYYDGSSLNEGLSISTSGAVGIKKTLTVAGATTLNGGLRINGALTIASEAGGDSVTVTWDDSNKMLCFSKGAYSLGAISAKGADDTTGGSGIDLTAMWNSLTEETADNYAGTLISINHIPVSDIISHATFTSNVTDKINTLGINQTSILSRLDKIETALTWVDANSRNA